MKNYENGTLTYNNDFCEFLAFFVSSSTFRRVDINESLFCIFSVHELC